jgi:hypothetical protein
MRKGEQEREGQGARREGEEGTEGEGGGEGVGDGKIVGCGQEREVSPCVYVFDVRQSVNLVIFTMPMGLQSSQVWQKGG